MTDREERFAEFQAEMRRKYPDRPDHYWEDMADRHRLQWKVDDLREGIAWLVGAYGFRVEQQPVNADLAELVTELSELLKTGSLPAASGAGVVPS
jgi:hypothetical protein